MKLKHILFTSLSSFAFATLSFGQTNYTWTGTAADGDWANAANWDANGVPVDDRVGTDNAAGLTLPDMDSITFTGAALPTSNIPDYGGNLDATNQGAASSPTMIFNSGGAITFEHVGRDSGFWTNRPDTLRNILTIGDGVGGGTEDVQVTFNGTLSMNRHADGAHSFLVNSDGTLIMNSNFNRWGFSEQRTAFLMIDGGTVLLNDAIDNRFFHAGAVEFLSLGGSFTADFGSTSAAGNELFPTITEVNNAIGASFISSLSNTTLEATDNMDGTFTLTPVELPDGGHWTGSGGTTWDQATTVNFSTNLENAPLVEGTFDASNALGNRIIFGDQFFDAGAGQPVTQDLITVATGGVDTNLIEFSNTALAYTVTSSDAFGINSSDSVTLNGGGGVTLLGEHAYAAPTFIQPGSTLNVGDSSMDGSITNSPISNNGALVFTTAGPATQDGALTGIGTVDKLGAGTLTVSSASTYTGATTISAGTLAFQNNVNSSSFDVATGTILALDNSTGANLDAGTTTFTGGGTLLKTGPDQILWAAGAATISFDSGALIDVQEGILRLGSNNNEVWTDNFSDLNVAAGATLLTQEANARVDAIDGEGTIQNGFEITGYIGFTMGVDNGTGAFDGVLANGTTNAPGIYIKEGTGVQTLGGDNTYTGDTIVENGSLQFVAGSSHVFVPQADMVSNRITGGVGSGSLTLDGQMNFNLDDIELAAGNSWLIIDDSNLGVTYGPNFSVAQLGGASFTEASIGVWTVSLDGFDLAFRESTGVLSVVSAGAAITVVNCGFNGTAFEVEFENLSAGTTYNLTRSANLQDSFPNVVDTITVTASTDVFTDAAPPATEAFYRLVEQ